MNDAMVKSMEINLSLHPKQFEVFADDSRIKQLVSGRRFGKTRVQIVSVVSRMFEFEGTVNPINPEVILVAMPTRVMAKRVLWRPLVALFEQFNAEINNSECRITIPGKPSVILAGMENGDALRGLRIYSCHLDESQDMDFSLIQGVIFPAMADTPNSKLFITGTPKGKANWFYEFSKRPDVSFHNYPTSDNPYIPRQEIESAKNQLSPKLFSQEFEASFTSFSNQIFTDFNPDLHTETIQPYYERIYMGVDFGDVNPAYVVVGYRDKQFQVLDAKRIGDGTNPVPSSVFHKELMLASDRWGVYRMYCDPSRPSAIIDIRRYGRRYGDSGGMQRAISADNPIEPGIAVVNSLFHQNRLTIATHLKSLIINLQSYHRDTKKPDKVADGQDDHTIDALRYCLYTINKRTKGMVEIPI